MNKRIGIGIVCVVLLAGIAWFAFSKSKQTKTAQETMNPPASQVTQAPPAVVPPPVTTPTPSNNTGIGQSALSYNDALKKYGSNRIQFDTSCQAVPNNVTYKSGTQVMFDNRANVKRTIVFNGKKYTITAYGYTVVSMVASKYPATAFIDCDSSQNIATVLIQK